MFCYRATTGNKAVICFRLIKPSMKRIVIDMRAVHRELHAAVDGASNSWAVTCEAFFYSPFAPWFERSADCAQD